MKENKKMNTKVPFVITLILVFCNLLAHGKIIRHSTTLVGKRKTFSFNSFRNQFFNQKKEKKKPSKQLTPTPSQKQKVLVLDVDNCLYCEKELINQVGCGIEQQIINNVHGHFNLSKMECDVLFEKYGTTIEGILQEHDGVNAKANIIKDYYDQVYNSIDMSPLILLSAQQQQYSTGYNHGTRNRLKDLLQSIPYPIYLASNSPRAHILRVLTALGLKDVIPTDRILSPDYSDSHTTKHHPEAYFQPLLEKYKTQNHHIVLIDDSLSNLQKAKQVGIDGIQVNTNTTLEEAIAMFLGHIPPNHSVESNEEKNNQSSFYYTFSDVQYLQSKNKIDAVSINANVWNTLITKLLDQLRNNDENQTLRVVDLGAGLLSMLKMILNGEGKDKVSLVDKILLDYKDENNSTIKELQYRAYEPNENLFHTCQEFLFNLGFVQQNNSTENEIIFYRSSNDDCPINVTVSLIMKDFQEETTVLSPRPHLIVGCCFADLLDPQQLTLSIMRLIGHVSSEDDSTVEQNNNKKEALKSTLIYFPITFSGTTQFYPPKPFATNNEKDAFVIPSDTTAFQLYADSLVNQHGHNLDPSRIITALKDIGGELLSRGSSNWIINPKHHSYMWETMLYFFGTSAAPEIMKRKWDAVGWINRARSERPTITVQNTDLLFSLPPPSEIVVGKQDYYSSSSSSFNEKEELMKVDGICIDNNDSLVEKISFTAPNHVEAVTEEWDNTKESHVGPGQIEVRSICSLISSGTELKIFKGIFENSPLDVNIKGMSDKMMQYPLSYGYSLVGVVTKCAPDVIDSEDIIGRLVFTFSPHASRVVVDRGMVQLVPDGVSPSDAIFMPSVETAISIVHDAHVRVGERVVVFGQGLIGLLVNAILAKQQMISKGSRFGSVTVVDTLSDRLAMASRMGASQAILPSEVSTAGPFDVAIEVSGNHQALQSAIDNTRSGGRIIVGSWYGDKEINLKLGIDFHRSHKTIKTSQVSTIPAELSTLWSKQRRYNLTWELIELLRPSILITKSLPLCDCQTAYELLSLGKELAISFDYGCGS